MAINRYDTPAESNYFNTFVPLPLDQITALGMKRQEDLERKQDVASKYIDQASLVDYIANSKDEEWVKNEYMPKLQQYAEEAMSVDLTNPVEWAKYSTKLRGVGTSERIRRIEESKSRWNDAQKVKQQLIANNKYNQLLDKDPAMGWDSENGVYNYMPQAYVDKAELFEQYYKHMKPRSKGVMNVGGVNVLREGIDANDVKTISAQAAQELAATPQGQQQIELFQKMYPDIAQNMNPVDILRMQMEDYGQQYIMSNDQVLPENLQGNGGKDTSLYDIIPIPTSGKGLDLDPAGVNGEFSIIYGAEPMTSAGTYANAGAGMATSGIPRSVPEGLSAAIGKNRENNISSAYNKIIEKYPIFAKGPNGEELTPQQSIDMYRTAVEEWKSTNSMVYGFGNDQVRDEWNSRVANSVTHREIILPKNNTPVSVEEAAKYYGYSLSEFVKILKDPNDPRIKVNAPSIGTKDKGWSDIQIVPKNGKSTARENIVISGTKDESAYFDSYFKLQNSLQSNDDHPVIVGESNDGSGRKIVAVPVKRMGYDEFGKPSLDISISEFVIDRNGNVVSGPIASDKRLNDYYMESIRNMTKKIHFDNDTKGLTAE